MMPLIPPKSVALRLWESIRCEAVKCGGCPHLRETRDAYATGDSPAIYSCAGDSQVRWDPTECPRVIGALNDLRESLIKSHIRRTT